MCGFNKNLQNKKQTKNVGAIIPRGEWGAKPIKGEVNRLNHPVLYARYGYTGTASCKVKNRCASVLQEYQQKFLDNDFSDQPFNFLIGGDGMVYEGRGWMLDADRPEKINRKIKGNAIDIGYIGDFSDEAPSGKMLEAAELLVERALKRRFLRSCPKILNLNDYKPVLED